jgi:hypothetical protein
MPAFSPPLFPSSPTIAGGGTPPSRSSAVPAIPTTTAQRYQATPTGYVITTKSVVANPNPSFTAPAGGDFSSFPPGCGTGGPCDWATYNAQQAQGHGTAAGGAPLVYHGTATSSGGGAIPSPDGGGSSGGGSSSGGGMDPASGTVVDSNGVTKTLVPIAQVQCALAALGDAPGLPPIAVNGSWDSVTQRWVDAYIAGHHAGEHYAVVGGSIQFEPSTALEFTSGAQCAGHGPVASSRSS